MASFSPHILVHAGFASSQRWHVEGYVIKKYKFLHHRQDKRWFTPLNLYRSYTLRPIAGLHVQVTIGETTYKTTTNELGYFMFDEAYEGHIPNEVTIDLLGAGHKNIALDVVAPNQTIVVSDIDDTILISYAREFFKKLYLLLFKRNKDRKQVANMARFYNQLKADKQAHFFYLTNSEWNLYPLIRYFLEEEGFPKGSLFMNWLKPHVRKIQLKNKKHKRDYLDLLIKFFPKGEFVLIGDSGQKDPLIYKEFVETYPDNVSSIGFRVMRNGLNEKRLKHLFQPFVAQGIKLNLFRQGSHLTEQKW